jgi:hypothetical protein
LKVSLHNSDNQIKGNTTYLKDKNNKNKETKLSSFFPDTPLLSARNQRLTDVVPPNHKDFETAQSIFNEGQTKSHPFTVSLRLVKVERICNPALSKGYEVGSRHKDRLRNYRSAELF